MKPLRVAVSLGLAIVALNIAGAAAQDGAEPSFGSPADVAFAAELWNALEAARLVGPRSITAQPYEGSDPHGVILMTLDSTVTMRGREDTVIVKRNYAGEDISIESVATNPDLFLGAITVMYRRERGYDPENLDWFWAKYSADGSLQSNPSGVPLAGRISKNPEGGCIACHRFAPGEDYVFLHDRFANQ